MSDLIQEYKEQQVANSEDNSVSESPTQISESPVPKELTIEEKAHAQGWRPKDQFHGNPDDWVDAGEYVRRGSLFREIDKLAKQNSELKQVVTTLTTTVSKAEERAYKKALAEIEAKKQQAIDVDDYKAALAEEEYVKREFQQKHEEVPKISEAPKTQVNPVLDSVEFKTFVAKNEWMNKTDDDSTLKKLYAQQLAGKYEAEHPNAPLQEVFDYVERQVAQRFDEPVKPSSVHGSPMRAPTHGSTKGDLALPREGTPERQVVDYLMRTGQDYKSYLKELKAQNQPN